MYPMKAVSFIGWTGIVFVCCLLFGNTIVPMEGHPIKVFSVQHNGRELRLESGESFILTISNPGSGGYVIKEPPEFDPQILILQKTEKKPPSALGKEGDFGSLEWHFQAKREGISVLIVRGGRPWEQGKAPVVFFEASIHVTE